MALVYCCRFWHHQAPELGMLRSYPPWKIDRFLFVKEGETNQSNGKQEQWSNLFFLYSKVLISIQVWDRFPPSVTCSPLGWESLLDFASSDALWTWTHIWKHGWIFRRTNFFLMEWIKPRLSCHMNTCGEQMCSTFKSKGASCPPLFPRPVWLSSVECLGKRADNVFQHRVKCIICLFNLVVKVC